MLNFRHDFNNELQRARSHSQSKHTQRELDEYSSALQHRRIRIRQDRFHLGADSGGGDQAQPESI